MTDELDQEQLIAETDVIIGKVIASRAMSQANGIHPLDPGNQLEEMIKKHAAEAEAVAENRAFREKFCAFVQHAISGTNAQARPVVTVLVTLNLTGVLLTPLTPIFFSAVALVVLEAGAKAYCD